MDYNKYIFEYNKIGIGLHGVKIVDNFLDEDTTGYLSKWLDGDIRTSGIYRSEIDDENILRILEKQEERIYKEVYDHYTVNYNVIFKERPIGRTHLLKWNLQDGDVMPVHTDCETPDGEPVLENEYYRYNLSAICYLNKDFVGAELTFPEIDLTIVPEPGKLVLFPSRYKHGVLNMESGKRYTMPTWFTFDIGGEIPKEELRFTHDAYKLLF
jgi:predicted 2-oxoglutarate/Fe(II)-dependent dioxygenase YbiX